MAEASTEHPARRRGPIGKTIELVRGENQIDIDEGETVRIASINLIATEY